MVALNSVQMALLRREMRFRSLAIRKILAVAVGGVVGIGMAIGGYGAWALVGQQLAAGAISVVALWTVSPWRPGLQASRADFGPLFRFGIHVVGGDLLNFLSRNTDRLLIGAFLGTPALGFYAVAYRILDTSQVLLVNAARKLAFPVFSRLQHDPERMRRAYSRVTRALSVIILPGYVGLALVAQEAVVVIFGQRWTQSGPVAAVLFLIGPVLTVQLFSGSLMNAVGHPEVTFRIRLITTVVNIVGFLVAVILFGSIIAVAAAFVLRGYLVMPLIMVWLRKYAGIPLAAHLGELRSPALATVVMAVAVVAVKLALPGLGQAALLAIEVAVGIVVFLGALLLIERALLADVMTLFLQAAPGGEAVARRLGITLPEGLSARPGRNRARRRGAAREEERDEPAAKATGAGDDGLVADDPQEDPTEDAFVPDAGLERDSNV
jgi:O-antigen/teichoic acid export membrane protein